MKESEMKTVGKWIAGIINDYKNKELLKKTKDNVNELTREFPLYD